MRGIVLSAGALLTLVVFAFWNWKPGGDNKGFDATALQEFRSQAEHGDAYSQYVIGDMYDYGRQGVREDKSEAVRWYRLSAAQGFAAAQLKLALMYSLGTGADRDYVKSHMWFHVAAENGLEGAEVFREHIQKDMTTSQIKEARKFARMCLSNKLVDCH